ncbi:uncharacterized protein LOC117103746 [Anneissia japonica]|uniref:uncharacterized protein LOC117103746 n=1 Tax=Anneissia japonica TaxID=1529436 RepID=UPI0014257F53|nr:uncharacterized protein LOC117103746 [Anneissia japonica]
MTSTEQDKPTWCKPFPVIGKGTFLFNVSRNRPFRIIVRDLVPNSQIDTSFIEMKVGYEEAILTCKTDNHNFVYPSKKPHPFFGNNIGIEKDLFCTYWLSYDSDRMIVKYGKGYRMNMTTILNENVYLVKESLRKIIKDAFFNPTVHRNVELYDEVDVTYSMMDVETVVDFDHLPFVSDRPPIAVDSSMLNMFDLDEGRFTYSASLPKECLELYTNVTAKNVDLALMEDDSCPDFNLVDAIRNSIRTPDALLHGILKSKEGEFGKSDPRQTYLRITLGHEFGNSPGVPYVLEIWPSDHGSPIHNHGNSYGVIRVLHGGLTINVYNKTSQVKQSTTYTPDDQDYMFDFNVKKDDVTWISPNWYQTHKLWNNTDDFCATIQCYKYGENDNTHWPYFDYVASCNVMDEFEPNSDLTFTELFNKLKDEFLSSKSK